MPHNIPWNVLVREHPGSSAQAIENEPDWTTGHQHRIGVRNRQNRFPGLTHISDEDENEPGLTNSDESSGVDLDEAKEQLFDERAKSKFQNLRRRESGGELVNFRDVINGQDDLSLRYPENRSVGWRYVLETTEDTIKNNEAWPANIKQRKKEEEAKKDKYTKDGVRIVGSDQDDDDDPNTDRTDEENDWKRRQGENTKHHNAYAINSDGSEAGKEEQTEYEKLRERYSPQEIALLRSLQHEKSYRASLKQNDGKRASPQTNNRTQISIDEKDQFSPDNWLPRSEHLIRRTGKHPMNGEAELTALYNGGLITPNELHYVRNHGAVPRLSWEFHKLDVESGNLVLTMDDVKSNFESINIPVALACDGMRRGEMNLIKKSKGFSWAASAMGCVYWKGPLLRDILLAAGVKDISPTGPSQQRWVNFQGADEPSEGKYETCIPLDYAMNPANDVLLAYEMNDLPLPPDHGYPLRLMIPGYVGGRCVKWLSKIWVTDAENTSHYHIWDNRVLPSFITEKDGEFASTMFHHPDTACNEQNLNSIIVKPAQGETISLSGVKQGKTYRIEGFAYDGGGHEVQRVEVSIDRGETWLYCIRKYPDFPIRHGNKFWTWLHWHVDIEISSLLTAKHISVRAWNVFKNTQPENPSWNTMGMMNNCWYTVKSEIASESDADGLTQMLFRHPVDTGSGDEGWMRPSEENKLNSAKQEGSTPKKQFTRDEIEKHSMEDDCWLVVEGKVYDATSVLAWHPGGKAAILGHAGKVHQETSDEFASIHDGFAYHKLNECILGVVTEKTAKFMKQNAEDAAKEEANSKDKDGDIALQSHRWVPIKLKTRENISEDTRRYTFILPDGKKDLGLGTCQHVQLGFHLKDKMLIRSYTPTKPLLPDPTKIRSKSNDNASSEMRSIQDGAGTFELVVKTYFPTAEQPGGAMSNILDCMPIGEPIEVRGPTGEIVYKGGSRFLISEEESRFTKINLILGGSGLTPGYALLARVALGKNEQDVQVRVVDANKSEKDILLHKELDHLVEQSKGRLKVTHVLSHPGDEWEGLSGHVNEDILKSNLFPPEAGSVCFLCGPPAMIEKAAVPALKDWGFEEDKNVFGF